MSKLATIVVALGALGARLCHTVPEFGGSRLVTLGLGGPGVSVYVGPRYGPVRPPLLPALCLLRLSLRLLSLLGAAATGAAGTRHERLRAHVRFCKGRSRKGSGPYRLQRST